MADTTSPLALTVTGSTRAEQLFPTLTPAQIARIAAHGRRRPILQGDVLVDAGAQVVPFFVVTAGQLEVVRISNEGETVVAIHGPGQFSGEVNMIWGGAPSSVFGCANRARRSSWITTA